MNKTVQPSENLERAVIRTLREGSAVWTPDCIDELDLMDWIDAGGKHPHALAYWRHVSQCPHCTQGYLALREMDRLNPQPTPVTANPKPTFRDFLRQLLHPPVFIGAASCALILLAAGYQFAQVSLREETQTLLTEKSQEITALQNQLSATQKSQQTDLQQKQELDKQVAQLQLEKAKLSQQLLVTSAKRQRFLVQSQSVKEATLKALEQAKIEAFDELQRLVDNRASADLSSFTGELKYPVQEVVPNFVEFQWKTMPNAVRYTVVIQRAENRQEVFRESTTKNRIQVKLPTQDTQKRVTYYVWSLRVQSKGNRTEEISPYVKFGVATLP